MAAPRRRRNVPGRRGAAPVRRTANWAATDGIRAVVGEGRRSLVNAGAMACRRPGRRYRHASHVVGGLPRRNCRRHGHTAPPGRACGPVRLGGSLEDRWWRWCSRLPAALLIRRLCRPGRWAAVRLCLGGRRFGAGWCGRARSGDSISRRVRVGCISGALSARGAIPRFIRRASRVPALRLVFFRLGLPRLPGIDDHDFPGGWIIALLFEDRRRRLGRRDQDR